MNEATKIYSRILFIGYVSYTVVCMRLTGTYLDISLGKEIAQEDRWGCISSCVRAAHHRIETYSILNFILYWKYDAERL